MRRLSIAHRGAALAASTTFFVNLTSAPSSNHQNQKLIIVNFIDNTVPTDAKAVRQILTFHWNHIGVSHARVDSKATQCLGDFAAYCCVKPAELLSSY